MRTRRWMLSMLTGMVAVAMVAITAAPAQAAEGYGFQPGSASATLSTLQAGAHPDVHVKFDVAREDPAESGKPLGSTKETVAKLPPGLVGNPSVLAACPLTSVVRQMVLSPAWEENWKACPRQAAVGEATVYIRYGYVAFRLPYRMRVYRLPTGPNEAPAFGMSVLANPIKMVASLRSDGDYGLNLAGINLPEPQLFSGLDITFWGVPADHQGPGPFWDGNPNVASYTVHQSWGAPLDGAARRPFMSNPTQCTGTPASMSLSLTPWADPDLVVTEDLELGEITGCDQLVFDPQIDVKPETTRAGAPSGYKVDLTVPQSSDADILATPNLKDAVVKLPEGVRIAPPLANGLAGCTDAELGLNSKAAEKCPQASKIGTVEIDTPLLDYPLNGSVYAGSQESNDPESGEMYRLFITAAGSGMRIKLRGSVRVNPETGQIEASFLDNPQLPFETLTLRLKGGDRAPLINPDECGTYTAEATLVPWGGETAEVVNDFEIDRNCPEAAFKPSFQAGSVDPTAGGSSPFVLAGAREDGDENMKTIREIKLPEGLLGNVGSVDLCAEAQAAAGNCPAGSRIGHVAVAAGAGSAPIWLPQAGKAPTSVSLTGPYMGAPYGLSIVVPAQAGPFDLGKVVVRSALHVDERTTQLTTGVDETRIYNPDGSLDRVIEGAMPQILKGVWLNLRQLRVLVDRDDFIVNPTGCTVKQVAAQAVSITGRTADLTSRYRASDCATLDFAPAFSARILDKGRKSTLRSFHPRTKFTVVPRKGDANIAAARVVLPSSTLLDQANIGTTCTRAQMAERNCPEASIVGYAKAWSPLLRKAVEGPVYLAANGGVRPLPDLAAVLDGEIRVVLQGEVATQRGGGKARLQNTFRVVPDAPVERFELTMRGGAKRGLLVNSTDLCRSGERGVAVFTGQNGRSHKLNPRIATSFKGCGKVRRQAARRKAARKAAAKSAARRAARG